MKSFKIKTLKNKKYAMELMSTSFVYQAYYEHTLYVTNKKRMVGKIFARWDGECLYFGDANIWNTPTKKEKKIIKDIMNTLEEFEYTEALANYLSIDLYGYEDEAEEYLG